MNPDFKNFEPTNLYVRIQDLVIADARKVADDVLREDQYTVASTQGHTHNGVDSLSVDYANLTNKFYYVTHNLVGTSAATSSNYSAFFTTPDPCIVIGATEVHTTAGTDVGAVSLQIEKLTGTTVPGSGTVLLNTAFDLKGTINTVQTGSLVTSSSPNIQNLTTYLAKGNRLALKLSGTPTAVANVTVVVKLLLVP